MAALLIAGPAKLLEMFAPTLNTMMTPVLLDTSKTPKIFVIDVLMDVPAAERLIVVKSALMGITHMEMDALLTMVGTVEVDSPSALDHLT